MTRFPALLALTLCLGATLAAQDFGRRERSFDAVHYRIQVSFDEAARSVSGITTITLRPLRPDFRRVELDAVRMNILGVKHAAGRALDFSYDSARLTVQLERAYAYGEKITLQLRYRCVPERGLYFISPNASYPGDPHQIWTQGQGEDNRHWFPSYDYPNDKATTEVIMTVPGEYETLSNGALKSKKKNADGTRTWHWSQDLPHSVYLVMLAAGRYKIFEDAWNGIPVRSYHYPGDNPADVRRAYATTAPMLKFFSEKIGIRYPWHSYSQIPVAHYLYGGMENTTATVLNDTRVVVDARTAQDISPEGLIAHELAHQWWGDYLTYIDWNNAWLNEGFATYFQQCWTQHAYGEDEFSYQRREGVRGYTDWCDLEGRIPVVSKGSNSRHNHYAKGAAVLHMLRVELGEEQFWRVMKFYGERHALGSVETNDLKRAIEDATGVNLHWFFSQWVLKAGYPDLRVRHAWDPSAGLLSIHFQQSQRLDSLCGYFRLKVPVQVRRGGRDTLLIAEIDGARDTVSLPLAMEPDFVSVDQGGTICGRIRHEQSTRELAAKLRGSDDAFQRIEAGRALVAHAGDAGIRAVLFDAARKDPFWGVRFQIANALVGVRADSVSYRDELKTLWLDLLGDPKSTIRSTALSGLNAFRDPALRSVYRKMLEDSSFYVEAGALNCLLTVDPSSKDAVLSRLESRSYQDVVALAAMDWVQRHRISEAEPVLITLAGPGGSPALRAKAFSTLTVLGTAPHTLLEIVKRQLEEPDWQLRVGAAAALVQLAPIQGVRMVRDRLGRETHSRAAAQMRELLKK